MSTSISVINPASSVQVPGKASNCNAKRSIRTNDVLRNASMILALFLFVQTTSFAQISIGGFEIPGIPVPELPLPSLPEIPLPNIPGVELGHKTNKWDVRHGLEQDGWWVAYGKEIGYEEYYVFSQAVEASVASRNPGPAMAYLQYVVEESVRTLISNAGQEYGNRLRRLAQDHLVAAMNDAIENGRINTFELEGMDVQVGLATYNRSESGVPLPNTFQPYMRVRIRAGGNPGGQSVQSNSGFRTGFVLLNNDYGPGGDVVIRMYHPQGGGRVFENWPVRGQQSAMLMMNGQNIVVGSDWGIQVVFGNGVESPIRPIGTIASHDGQIFAVQSTRIFGQ